MKAIRIHGPRDARLEELPTPTPGPDDVLVRVRACGICGTDVEFYDGVMFYLTSGMQKTPFIPGHEWSGEVVELGDNVSEFAVGDRVVGECSVGCQQCAFCCKGWYNQCPNRTETGVLNRDGGFAEYIAFPRHFLHKCNELEYEEAAFIEPTGIALYPCRLASVVPDDYVAIMGAGPIGLFAVQTAKAYGSKKVILIGRRQSRLEAGRAVGADAVIDIDSEDVQARVAQETGGHMVDVVIEAVGKAVVWETIMSVIAPRARIVMTGLFAGERCAVDFDPLVVNNVSILGSLGAPNLWGEAIALHTSGKIQAGPLITHRLPLDQFVEGLEIFRNRTDGAIKVVLEP